MRVTITRRAFAAGALCAAGARAHAAEPPSDTMYADDFDELWRTLSERYCYFGEKTVDWAKARSVYRPMAIAAQTASGFVDVIRRVLAELYDPHTHLHDPPDGSPRWPLFDLLGEVVAGGVRIAAIEADSAASRAGLSIGDIIQSVDGVPVQAAIRALMPRCLSRPDSAAEAYACNVAIAGRKGSGRTMMVAGADGRARLVDLPLHDAPPRPPVEYRALAGNIGMIVIRSFADDDIVRSFDHALGTLKESAALIIDVRNNGGGDTAVARPIMGRFIGKSCAYARMRRRDGVGLSQAWTEYVEPRGPFTYAGPVMVLTSPWSGSMAEGFPMGMRDIGRAKIVGTRMMGLSAAVYTIRLDRTGVEAQYSAEPVYDTQDRPRSHLRPDVEMPNGEDALPAAVAALKSQLK